MLSSTGPSAEWQGGVLGVFDYLQQYKDSPAYRLRHSADLKGIILSRERDSVARTPWYLYRTDSGWRVGPDLGGLPSYLLNTTMSNLVPTNNWLYYDDEGVWKSDPEIVATSDPSVLGAITISLRGAAARRQPGSGGEYRAKVVGRWWD